MLWAAVYLLLFATVGPPGVLLEGNVGCLFSERLCLEDEWCYDDFAFGRCLGTIGVDEDDLFRYNLERDILHIIGKELRRLFALGYRWSHVYTQCRLQALLYATKNQIPFEENACSHLSDQDLEGALKALEGQIELDPKEVAIIRYTPSVENPHASYADEVYYPPAQTDRERIMPSNAVDILDMEDPYAQYQLKKRNNRDLLEKIEADSYYNDLSLPNPQGNRDDIGDLLPLMRVLNELKLNEEDVRAILTPDTYQRISQLMTTIERATHGANFLRDEKPATFERYNYNTPEGFRSGWESRDIPESRIYLNDDADDDADGMNYDDYYNRERNFETQQSEYGSGHENEIAEPQNNDVDDGGVFRELRNQRRIYTEGGVVYVPQGLNEDGGWDERDGGIWSDEMGHNYAFKRPERLDVKKPGPPFDPQINPSNKDSNGEENDNPLFMKRLPNQAQRLEGGSSMWAKRPMAAHPNPTHETYDVDTDYIYVKFKDNINSWKSGEYLIGNITRLVKLNPSAVTHGRVDYNEVTFKAVPNSRGWNSTDIVKKIYAIKDELKQRTGVEITSIGLGDKTKFESSVISTPLNYDDNSHDKDQFYLIMSLFCGILGALIVSAGLLLILRRHLNMKEKIKGLSGPDTEASKDYQDLCRARMATKSGQAHTAESATNASHPPTAGRITSLSKESEQSPSSRSSTSSWSEEPALHNMDISTGHMVLSYMEDHLKNKDRLEQEWVALCAYLAEPCEMTVAINNADKNRYEDVVPYDHARVVLNELSNLTGVDYINASSITDHDPRNPAYIATQGPLPHTAADFWQLIWEQGAVVVVTLTRLTENGTAMCYRYWPEEGSELYHIYEVHLVSEHIWCDDYLVRSFYLKNVRTGETRTVTQFHFLSWPECGVPSSTRALLEFRRKVNKSYRGRSCPIVVHCSDGAGRTGTYCLIDMVLSRMAKGAKEIDIAATLEHLRDQRPKMVASKQQFEFVLTAVAEEVHAILKALPPPPPTSNQQQQQQQETVPK